MFVEPNTVDDAIFLLTHVLRVGDKPWIVGMPSEDERVAILTAADEFFRDELAPLRSIGDAESARIQDGRVLTPPGFVRAYARLCETGWNATAVPEMEGGAGLPSLLTNVIDELAASANQAFAMYYGFLASAVRAIRTFATPVLADRIIPELVSGAWTATMCMTEPQAGSDLTRITTRATPIGDGSYAIWGDKIFISGGDHDLAENIVHILLARCEDESRSASAGLSDLGVFLVPRVHLGTGALNNVELIAIEHKLGLRGNATCALKFEGAIGYRLASGAQGSARGMAALFDMMNHARLSTSVSALGLGAAATKQAMHYALERRSGRAGGDHPRTDDASPILHHPDVQRMLLSASAVVEGSRALIAWAGMEVAKSEYHPDQVIRIQAKSIVHLITPILKSFITDGVCQVCDDCIQIHGGHGYIEETGIAQYFRDARVSRIYEGANGIQAHDFVMRRLPADRGEAASALINEMRDFARELSNDSTHADLSTLFIDAIYRLDESLMIANDYQQNAPSTLLFVSSDLLTMFGIVLTAWRLLESSRIAERLSSPFASHKLSVAKHWIRWHVALTASIGLRIRQAGVVEPAG